MIPKSTATTKVITVQNLFRCLEKMCVKYACEHAHDIPLIDFNGFYLEFTEEKKNCVYSDQSCLILLSLTFVFLSFLSDAMYLNNKTLVNFKKL